MYVNRDIGLDSVNSRRPLSFSSTMDVELRGNESNGRNGNDNAMRAARYASK
jgi:hypothetical protein